MTMNLSIDGKVTILHDHTLALGHNFTFFPCHLPWCLPPFSQLCHLPPSFLILPSFTSLCCMSTTLAALLAWLCMFVLSVARDEDPRAKCMAIWPISSFDLTSASITPASVMLPFAVLSNLNRHSSRRCHFCNRPMIIK